MNFELRRCSLSCVCWW